MSHPDKIHNQNNQQVIANDTRWKKQIILYTRAFVFARPQKISLYSGLLRFSNIRHIEKALQGRLQNVENKGSQQRNQEWHSRWTRNVRRHQKYSTWFSNDVICFCPCCRGVKLPSLVLHPLTTVYRKSALGLHSANAVIVNNSLIQELNWSKHISKHTLSPFQLFWVPSPAGRGHCALYWALALTLPNTVFRGSPVRETIC